jgi:hypothetical protein
MCFEHDTGSAAPAGQHGHEDHEGPDSDSDCCVDVPTDAHAPWAVAVLDLPCVRRAEPVPGPEAPTHSAPATVSHLDPLRSTVLLR